LKFEHVVVEIHRSLPWMLGKEEGLYEDLTGHSSGRRSNGCGRAVRSGGGNDLSSSKNEFLFKRTPKEGGEWMWWWIMRLPTPFIWQRREGRRYRGGETIDGERIYSMLLFQGEEMKGITYFGRGNEHAR
jgi:hypothetical protein